MLGREDVRRKLRSTNAAELHHEEVQRRTRVTRIFPHEARPQRWLTAPSLEREEPRARRPRESHEPQKAHRDLYLTP